MKKYILILAFYLINIYSSYCINKFNSSDIDSINLKSFYGKTVNELLSSFDAKYLCYSFYPYKVGGIEGCTFIYPFNDSLDLHLYIRVKNFKYLNPAYNKEEYWDNELFKKETIDEIIYVKMPKDDHEGLNLLLRYKELQSDIRKFKKWGDVKLQRNRMIDSLKNLEK